MTQPSSPSVWAIATDRSVLTRALRIALIVGTVLMIINHGDRIVTGQMTGIAYVKCLLTYLVPFAVSTYSSVMAVRDRKHKLDQD